MKNDHDKIVYICIMRLKCYRRCYYRKSNFRLCEFITVIRNESQNERKVYCLSDENFGKYLRQWGMKLQCFINEKLALLFIY